MPTAPRTITNRFAGTCSLCNNRVAAAAGVAIQGTTGWTVQHNAGECPPAVDQPAPRRAAERGYYLTTEGDVVHVRALRTNPNRSAAYRLVISYRGRAQWSYQRGLIFNLGDAATLTQDDAIRLGHLHGVCAICGRTLTDPESVQRGIGPVCARRMGWVDTSAVRRRPTTSGAGERVGAAHAAEQVVSSFAWATASPGSLGEPVGAAPRPLATDQLGHGEVL